MEESHTIVLAKVDKLRDLAEFALSFSKVVPLKGWVGHELGFQRKLELWGVFSDPRDFPPPLPNSIFMMEHD